MLNLMINLMDDFMARIHQEEVRFYEFDFVGGRDYLDVPLVFFFLIFLFLPSIHICVMILG